MNKIIYLTVILFNIFYFNIAKTEEIDWIVSQIAGDAIIKKPGFQKKRLELYDNFAPGDLIATSANGTVGLSRDNEAMVVSANSIIELPKNNNSSQITLIFQKLGTIIFSAKKRNKKHFEVRTPYSAAIVKGTTFAISVNQYNSQLQVFEGAVLLNGRGREESYIIKAGNKSLTPREISKKILIKKIKRSSAINPHLGNDVSKLFLNYVKKIEIGNIRENNFSVKSQNTKSIRKSTIGTVNRGNNKNKSKTNKSKYIPEKKPNYSNNGNDNKKNDRSNNSNGNSSFSSSSNNGNSSSSSKSNNGTGSGNSSSTSNNGNGNGNSSSTSSNGNGNGNSSSTSSNGNGNDNSSSTSSNSNGNGNSSSNSSNGNGNGNSNSNSDTGNGNSNSNKGNGKGKK